MTDTKDKAMMGQATNTDLELYREPDKGNGSFYSDSIHVTEGGGIGINIGGHVIVKSLQAWHALAMTPTHPYSSPVEQGTLSEEDRQAILECASDLEASINAEYRGTLDYPSQKIKYDRDMQPVIKVRAIIDRLTTPPAPQVEQSAREVSADDRKIMGTADDAKASLIAKAAEWRRLRQPLMATAKEHQEIDSQEREARFQLANAALLWLWHQENPAPQAGEIERLRDALGEIANRSSNFMDDDAADWLPSIYKISCEAIGGDPWPLLNANGHDVDNPDAIVTLRSAQAPARTYADGIEDALRDLIIELENGQNHDEGAFDDSCPVCIILAKLRALANKASG